MTPRTLSVEDAVAGKFDVHRSRKCVHAKNQTTSINVFQFRNNGANEKEKSSERVWRVLRTRIILMNRKFSVFHSYYIICSTLHHWLSTQGHEIVYSLAQMHSEYSCWRVYVFHRYTYTIHIAYVTFRLDNIVYITMLAAFKAQQIFKIRTFLTGRCVNVSLWTTKKYAFSVISSLHSRQSARIWVCVWTIVYTIQLTWTVYCIPITHIYGTM